MSIIGICGNARSGKDTMADLMIEVLADIGVKAKKIALADELKEECRDLVWKNLGIDVFTSDSQEKNIIRPLLVTWGTHVRRKLDPDVWIKKAVEKMTGDELIIISDIRFQNELEWLRSKDSYCFFVERIGENGEVVPPANEEEAVNSPLLKENSDFQLSWATVGDDNVQILKSVIVEIIEKTVSEEAIKSWTQTFA
jgi:hypothetical protein